MHKHVITDKDFIPTHPSFLEKFYIFLYKQSKSGSLFVSSLHLIVFPVSICEKCPVSPEWEKQYMHVCV